MNTDLDCLKNKTVFIFGAGLAGQCALENLQHQVTFAGFIDNDASKSGTKLAGYPVFEPSWLKNACFDMVLIASEYFEQISQQLLHNIGLAREKIFVLPAHMTKAATFGEDISHTSNALKVLFTVTDCLNKSGENYYVDAGTLLGIYRDGQLIPWDDDLDIAVNAVDLDNIKNALTNVVDKLEKLFDIPWQVEEHFAGSEFGAVPKGAVRSLKLKTVEARDDLPMMDFFVKYVAGERMDYSLASRGISMPSSHLLNTVEFQFKEQIIRFPANVESYLSAHYGDWKTPVRDWNLSMLKNATVY